MKITTHLSKEKQSQMIELLKYGTVMVFIDSRHPDVLVPDQHKNDYQLRLNFDYDFQIDDFRVLPDRLEASLSFNQQDFFCVVPFTAVYLMVNHEIQRGSLFVDSVPVEMLELFATSEQAQQEEQKQQVQPVVRLHSIDTESNLQKDSSKNVPKLTEQKDKPKKESSKKEKTNKTKQRSHLRVIK